MKKIKIMIMTVAMVALNVNANERPTYNIEYNNEATCFDIGQEEALLNELEHSLKRKRSEEPASPDWTVFSNEDDNYEVTSMPALEDAPLVRDAHGRLRCPAEGCGQTFGFESKLKQHMRTHTGEKPYACPHAGCGKSFTSNNTLKRHMPVHTGETAYACNWPGCGKPFPDNSNLSRHRRIHTGEKDHVCKLAGCGKAFARPGDLKRHMESKVCQKKKIGGVNEKQD